MLVEFHGSGPPPGRALHRVHCVFFEEAQALAFRVYGLGLRVWGIRFKGLQA